MANCKICNIEIPDGSKYCKDCRDKKLETANESYLDDLLNSVRDSSPSMEDIYKIKNSSSKNNKKSEDKHIATDKEYSGFDTEIDISDDISAMLQAELENQDELALEQNDLEDFDQFNLQDTLDGLDHHKMITEDDLLGETAADLELFAAEDIATEDITAESIAMEDVGIQDTAAQSNTAEDVGMKDTDAKNNTAKDIGKQETVTQSTAVEDTGIDEEIDNDILSLLGQLSPEDPVSEELMAINDLLKGTVTAAKDTSMPSDVGEVFSDALKAVESLKDYDFQEDPLPDVLDLGDSIMTSPPYTNKEEKAVEKSQKAQKNEKKKTADKKVASKKAKKSKKEKSSKSLFQRLFGNVKDEKTAEQHLKEMQAAAEPVQKVKKSKKKEKPVKDAALAEDADSGQETENKTKKQLAKEKREAKKKERAERKAQKSADVIEEIDEDPGRINRVGAAIVFAFFGILASVMILGTDKLSYNISIKHAKAYFDHQKYNEAYEEVSGTVIKDEDLELYDKIKTVMFVNKQLNSYHNYSAMKDYPKALDSLLKGLERYDKYIELATIMGIKSDMDYVRVQILAELEHVFQLSEKKAMKILASKDTKTYSIAVYNVVMENMTY